MSPNDIALFNKNELIKFFKQNNLDSWVPYLEGSDIDGHTLLSASEYQIKIWFKVRTIDLWQIILKMKTNPGSFKNPFEAEPRYVRKQSFSGKDHTKLEQIIGNRGNNNIRKPRTNFSEEDDGYLEPVSPGPPVSPRPSPKNQTPNNSNTKTFSKPKIPTPSEPVYESEESYEDLDCVKGKTKTFGGNKFNSFPRLIPKLNAQKCVKQKTYVNQSPLLKRQENVKEFQINTQDTYEYIEDVTQNKMKGRKLPPLPTEESQKISINNRKLPPPPDNIYECDIIADVPKGSQTPIVNVPRLPSDLKSQIQLYNKNSLTSILNRPLPQPPDQYVTLISNDQFIENNLEAEDYYDYKPEEDFDILDSPNYSNSNTMQLGKGRPPAPLPLEDKGEYIRPSSPKEYTNRQQLTAAPNYLIMQDLAASHASKPKSYDQHFPNNLPESTRNPRNYAPQDNVDLLNVNLNNEPFYRNTDRKGAKLLLRGLEDGTFLFRHSENPNFFLTISIIYQKKFFNVGIVKNGNKIRCDTLTEDLTPEFSSLTDFVKHFQIEPITIKKDEEYYIYLKPTLPKTRF